MSDYDDRGAYTPPADRLAFDPRQPVRGGGPAPVTLIVSGLVLVALVGGVFFLYRDGFRHRSAAPALVGAPVADVKTPAAPPPVIASDAPPAGLVVDKTTAPAPAPAFAPPPAHPLPAQAALAPAQISPRAATPVVAAASPPLAARPAPPPQVVMLAPDAPPKSAAAPPRKLASAAAPGFAGAAPPVERPVVRHAAPVTIASLTDTALAHRTRAARATREAAPAARFAEEPRLIAPPPAHHAVVAQIKGAQIAAAPRPAATLSVARVQIGAFSSPTLADQGWRDVARLTPDAMRGKGKAVQPMDRDDGTTLYRTYVTGFATVTAAQAFCAELQASGKACMVK